MIQVFYIKKQEILIKQNTYWKKDLNKLKSKAYKIIIKKLMQ